MQTPREYIDVPDPLTWSRLERLWLRARGAIVTPWVLLEAALRGVPGLGFHVRCAAAGVRRAVRGRTRLGETYVHVFFPVDSTRYFEFDEIWKRAKDLTVRDYLDVSSPRMLPLLLSRHLRSARVTFVNPDGADLDETRMWAQALGLADRSEFLSAALGSSRLPAEAFDLVTSISVLEHIPDDIAALEELWAAVRPGGRLLITVPARASPLEQFTNRDSYGLLPKDANGYSFWQRYYDRTRLNDVVFKVLGSPVAAVLYGERQGGEFKTNCHQKRLLGRGYPMWNEPLFMARSFRYFSSVDQLPGEGVLMLEFVKPSPKAGCTSRSHR